MAIATYSASLRTRKTSSSSNAKSDRACQEYYTDDYNYVGIIHFSGMSLANKVITGITLTVTSAKSGHGASHTKTVYMRKSKYQAVAREGITGANYVGDALGTFDGSFYDNTTSYAMSGTLFTNMAAYIQAGNNTFTIYNPSPSSTASGYSYNYFQWTAVTMTVSYEEAASVPTTSASSVEMGSSVTIYTNRASTAATHTITYAFGSTSGTIASSVGASTTWTPALTLASQIPSATSGICTITCKTYVNSTLTGTKTCSITLTVPASVKPTISTVSVAEATSGIAAQFAAYVRTKSTVTVTITAAGARGSTISSYRTTVGGATYTASTFTTATLNTAGTNAIVVTVTDSRGRTASKTTNITVVDYSPPSLTSLSAQRCNSDGSAAQMDGTKVRITTAGSVSSVGSKNTVTCTVYYKLSTATSWSTSTTIAARSYKISATNKLLSQTFDVLKSYDIKVRLADFFGYVEQTVSVGTKQVMMDFYKDGSGIAFGKVAETSGTVEFGWPVSLSTPLPIAQGGTGKTTVAAARNALGLGNTSGAVPIANGGTGATTAAAARNALGLGNTTGAVPLANGGTGATTAANARTNLGITPANIGAAASSHNHAASNITSGTIAAARLPYKFAYGSTTIDGDASITVSYSSAGFTSVPKVFASYSTTGSNWSGDNGAIKIHSKTTTSFGIVVGGNFGTARAVDWFAIGT